jgi:GrpB-like predicted nucleotidyltransferase (UPF0157 family)
MDKRNRPYKLVEYDPTWPTKFTYEKEKISDIFRNIRCNIEHIGSTSVPGMLAKPQIDILVTVHDLGIVDGIKSGLLKAGYIHAPEADQYMERRFFKAEDSGERTVTVHILTNDNPRADQYIHFRDYLRFHPEEVRLYSEVKRKAYNGGKSDRVEYSVGKKAFLEQLLHKSAAWRGF